MNRNDFEIAQQGNDSYDPRPLRRCMFRCLLGLLVAALIGLGFVAYVLAEDCATDACIAERHCADAADVDECIFGPAQAQPTSVLIEILDSHVRIYTF